MDEESERRIKTTETFKHVTQKLPCLQGREKTKNYIFKED